MENISFRKKTKFKLPEGAEVTEEKVNYYVEEIENGYIVTKDVTVEFLLNDDIERKYYEKKKYVKSNPMKNLELDLGDEEEKSFADNF